MKANSYKDGGKERERESEGGSEKERESEKGQSTSGVVREHVVMVDHNGLVTITGGKWTTYRR